MEFLPGNSVAAAIALDETRQQLLAAEQAIQTTAKESKEKQWRTALNERFKEQEEQSRAAVYSLLGTPVFKLDEPLTVRDHYYDQDDGIGESYTVTWLLARDGDTHILSQEKDGDNFGWSGSKPYHIQKTWLFTENLQPVETSSMSGNFKLSQWYIVNDILKDMRITLLRRQFFAAAEKLLERYGVITRTGFDANGARIKDESARLNVRVQGFENETAWTLIRAHDPFSGEFREYVLKYADSATSEVFSINVSPTNRRPYVWTDYRNETSSHSYQSLMVNHMDICTEGLRVIEYTCKPPLFDAEEMTR